MDARTTNFAHEVDPFFNQFCDRIFAMPWLRHAIKLMTCERNTGHEAGRLAIQFKQRGQNVECIRQKADRDYGWTTGPGGTPKARYAAVLLDTFQRDGIVYAEDFVVTMSDEEKKSMTYAQRVKKNQDEFEAELTRMKTHVELPDGAFGQKKTTFSGKLDPEGRVVAGLNDDRAMSIAMNTFIIYQAISGCIPTLGAPLLHVLRYGRNSS